MPVEDTGGIAASRIGNAMRIGAAGDARLQVWDMSKPDKGFTQSDRNADMPADGSSASQPLQFNAAPQPQQESEQLRQFSSWLDRTMPRLMEQLGGAPSSAVTSPSLKPKH